MAKLDQDPSEYFVQVESPNGSFSSTYTAVNSLRGQYITIEDYTTDETVEPQLCDSPESFGSGEQIITPEEEIECLVLDDQSQRKATSEKCDSFQFPRGGKVSHSLDACTKKLGAQLARTQLSEEATGVLKVECESEISATGSLELPAIFLTRDCNVNSHEGKAYYGQHESEYRSVVDNGRKPSCLSTAVLGFCLMHKDHQGRVGFPIFRPAPSIHAPKALGRLPVVRKASPPEVNRDLILRQGHNPACVPTPAETNAIPSLTDLLDDTSRSPCDVAAAGPSRLALKVPVPVTRRLIRDGADWVKMFNRGGEWKVKNGEKAAPKA